MNLTRNLYNFFFFWGTFGTFRQVTQSHTYFLFTGYLRVSNFAWLCTLSWHVYTCTQHNHRFTLLQIYPITFPTLNDNFDQIGWKSHPSLCLYCRVFAILDPVLLFHEFVQLGPICIALLPPLFGPVQHCIFVVKCQPRNQ